MSAPPTTGSCRGCGTPLPPQARFCPECGLRAVDPEAPTRVAGAGAAPVEWFGAATPGRSPLTGVRARVAGAVESLRVRAAAADAVRRLRAESLALAQDRERRLRELGEAVYTRDAARERDARSALEALDGEIRRREEQMHAIAVEAEQHLAGARSSAGPTLVTEPAPNEQPGPAIVPEPTPVPSEPARPAIVPEPSPVPSEQPSQPVEPEPGPR